MAALHSLQLLVPTKLTAPQPLHSWVQRERLLVRLNDQAQANFVLIVAPAGFGKSTLAAQWVLGMMKGEGGRLKAIGQGSSAGSIVKPASFAWLTLDEHDQDGLRFLAYLAGAIARAVPASLATTRELLAAPDPAPLHVVLQGLLVDLSAIPGGLTLVLDDYHLVTADSIHQAVSYLLRNLPAGCRLVVLSRFDPPLPLARLRAEGQLGELRAADLRFTEAETSALLAAHHGAPPDAAQVVSLHQQTEGWAVALQLAALSQSGTPSAPIGNGAVNRQIAEYLADEVLACQPPATQELLLALAVPERLCAGLCAALSDDPHDMLRAENQLEQLVRANLFLHPLDEEGQWYRFHHLFRELLLRRLRLTAGEAGVRALQLKAARWLAEAELVEEAVRLFIAADAGDAAADLVEGELLAAMDRAASHAILGRWLALLPAALVSRRPGLAIIAAHLAAVNIDLPAVEEGLARVDAHLAAGDLREQKLPWPSFLADLAVLRATMHCWRGRTAEAATLFWSALDQHPLPAFASRSLIFLGLAAGGVEAYAEREAELARRSHAALARGQLGQVIDYYAYRCGKHLLTGMLDRLAEDAAALNDQIARIGLGQAPASFARYCSGVVAYERDELTAAAAHFGAVVSSKYQVNYTTYLSGVIGLALIAAARGAYAQADDLVREAQIVADEAGGAFLRNQALGCAVRVALFQEDCGRALAAAARIEPDIHLGSSLWFETPRLSQARAYLAAGGSANLERAASIIDGCMAEVEPLNHTRLLIATLPIRALLHEARGEPAAALADLERAIALAEPRGFVRSLADLGRALHPLLRELAEAGVAPAYLKGLRAAPAQLAKELPPEVQPRLAVPDMLTRREAEIIALLAERWSNQEIADRLVVTVNTVRKHTSTIYEKLGVGSRREAVAAARSLGLLPPG